VLRKATCTTWGGPGSQVRSPELPLHINKDRIAGPPRSDYVDCHKCFGAVFIGYSGVSASGGGRCEVCDGAGVAPPPHAVKSHPRLDSVESGLQVRG